MCCERTVDVALLAVILALWRCVDERWDNILER